MESTAQAAESLVAASSGEDALRHAIRAAELYMKAAKEASNKSDAARMRRKCQELITHAEKLKTHLPDRNQERPPATWRNTPASDIIQGGSLLHGSSFPPWEGDPGAHEFETLPNKVTPFTDETIFSLSSTQANNFASWARPTELFNLTETSDKKEYEELMMQVSDQSNLVQDITTDCSVVASLSAALNVLTGKHAVLASIMHPFDHGKGRPRLSKSGKYVMRMNFNGCARRVVIDDRLPASRTDRALFVVDRQNPYLLWPALLEKAYLKVRGGYDFPGSNSGTDLWVLTGWIPEQVFLQREDFDIDEIWNRIKTAHEAQNVVITLGTGRISAEEEELMGLIGEHDYAVENIDSSGGERNLLIKNPWCDGPLMTRAGWSTPPFPKSGQSAAEELSHADITPNREDHSSTIWVAFEDVVQHFESMYMNWNPSLFPCRQDHHFCWEIPPKIYSNSLTRNPQFTIASINGGPVWILVSRHFVDAELEIARGRRDSMAAVSRQLGFMSILVFDNRGKKVQISDGEIYRGPYVDSPQTLARLDMPSNQAYTVVIDQHEFPLSKYSFTMSLFSSYTLNVGAASEAMSHFGERVGAWSRRTAGGNSACTTYYQNPQYSLSIDKASPVSIMLSADVNEIHVHVDIVWARGGRVTSLRVKDLVASSGEYRRGCALASIPMLEPGKYTLVCSTFEAGQLAQYAVRVASMVPITLASVPAQGAGRLQTKLPPFGSPEAEGKARLQLQASWLTKASVSMHIVVASESGAKVRSSSSLMIRVSVVQGSGPEQVLVTVSGDNEFQTPTGTIRTPEFDIEPDRTRIAGLWIVVESMGSRDGTLAVEGEILSDFPVHVGDWEPI